MTARQVDLRYYPFQVTVPAGTLSAAGFAVDLEIAHGIAQSCHLDIPTGHAGLTGWQLALAGTVILPFHSPDTFVVAEDTHLDFVLGIEVDVQLQMLGYNTDVYDHTFYFRVALATIATPTLAPAPVAARPLPPLPASLSAN